MGSPGNRRQQPPSPQGHIRPKARMYHTAIAKSGARLQSRRVESSHLRTFSPSHLPTFSPSTFCTFPPLHVSPPTRVSTHPPSSCHAPTFIAINSVGFSVAGSFMNGPYTKGDVGVQRSAFSLLRPPIATATRPIVGAGLCVRPPSRGRTPTFALTPTFARVTFTPFTPYRGSFDLRAQPDGIMVSEDVRARTPRTCWRCLLSGGIGGGDDDDDDARRARRRGTVAITAEGGG